MGSYEYLNNMTLINAFSIYYNKLARNRGVYVETKNDNQSWVFKASWRDFNCGTSMFGNLKIDKIEERNNGDVYIIYLI